MDVDVTKGLEAIGLPIEECTVAVHQRIVVLEDDIPRQDLRIWVDLLIEAPEVHVLYDDPLLAGRVGRRPLQGGEQAGSPRSR